jgi:hypothetical protein
MITKIFIVNAGTVLLSCVYHPAVLATDYACKFHFCMLDGSQFAESELYKLCAGRHQQKVFQFKQFRFWVSDLYKVWNMPQDKLKVKTKLPAKSKPKKKAKGPAVSKRGSTYNLTCIKEFSLILCWSGLIQGD